MNEQKKQRLLKEIEIGIKDNKRDINKAIEEEFEKGNVIRIDSIEAIIKEYNNLFQENIIFEEDKSKAVICSGNPEISFKFMLHSIIYNNKISIVSSGCKIINEILYTIIKESMKELKIDNSWIDYDSSYTEKYIKDNQKKYDEIIYIGDYFEFENFKWGINTPLKYNSYGYIKLFIDKIKNKDEYRQIMKYAYINNIYIETYDDLDDFLKDGKKEDYAVAYVEDDQIKKIGKDNKFGTLLINEFPFEKYVFKIN